MNSKRKWITTTIVLVIVIGGGIAYNYYWNRRAAKDTGPAPSARSMGVLNVNGAVIREQPLTDMIYTTGSLLPDEEVDLLFETSGMIVEINFQEGTSVRKGQLLAKVNDKPLLAQLSRYEAQVKLAENRVFRQSALLEKDAVSQEAYEQARTELETLKADIDLVKANIALTELRAPFDGVIGLRQVSEGAYASPSVVMATLTKLSPLKIDFSVPERYASEVAAGTRLTFEVDGSLNRYDATVYATESHVDPDTRTFAVRALYPNTRGELIPGRFANVEIRLVEIPDAIAVPTEALVPEMGVDKVFLYKDGKAEPVEIATGIRTSSRIQVLRGLNVGDTLITSGTLQLRMGLDVTLDHID